jgi:phosphate transport system protein
MVHLHRETERLGHSIRQFAKMVSLNLELAYHAFMEQDVRSAEVAIARDREIDLTEVDIEEDCLKILALYQPVANDLRYVIAILKINNDLERIGDQAKSIAHNTIYLCRNATEEEFQDFGLQPVYDCALQMFQQAMDSLFDQNTVLARAVCARDSEVNTLTRSVIKQVIAEMRKRPEAVPVLEHYLNTARRLERVADHATNIAEDAIYFKEGEIVRHNVLAKDGFEERL